MLGKRSPLSCILALIYELLVQVTSRWSLNKELEEVYTVGTP